MRILFLCTDAYGGHGGISLYNRELICALAAHPQCEEVVVIPRITREKREPIPPKVRFVADAARGAVAFVASTLRAIRPRPDLVICGHVNLLPLARAVSASPVLMIYGIEAWKPLRDPFSNRVIHDCRAVVSISVITLSRMQRWSGYSGRTFLLPNPIRLGDYGVQIRDPDLARRYGLMGKRVLLTVGRLAAEERYKGFDEVLEVLPSLDDSIVYLIAGGGSDLPRLKRKAHELGVSARVIFTGFFNEGEKPKLYSLADVYVMPSQGEGFGFVLLEAMACGVPVIASRHDGGREAVLDGRLGVLVDPSDRAGLRVAILDGLERRERQIPEGLDSFAYENFQRRALTIVDAIMVAP